RKVIELQCDSIATALVGNTEEAIALIEKNKTNELIIEKYKDPYIPYPSLQARIDHLEYLTTPAGQEIIQEIKDAYFVNA
ncbi:MAG: hypothetical protein AAFY76_19335, partial [Cyanobacteria bacterium J06649_11]